MVVVISTIHLALGSVLPHRAVTSAVIGPRALERLTGRLGADAVRLSPGVLDAVDALAPPGVNISPDDVEHVPPALTDPALRRR